MDVKMENEAKDVVCPDEQVVIFFKVRDSDYGQLLTST